MSPAEDPAAADHAALFRLEFGGASGWGHLVRCGALAAELRQRGWRCDLWTTSESSGVPAALREPFTQVVPFQAGAPVPRGYGWLVADNYAVSDALLGAWRGTFRGRILAIDDEARRQLTGADLVLNARPGIDASAYPPGPVMLLGERYALLRPGLARPHHPGWVAPTGTMPVLVMLGGTDPAGLTPVVLDALADLEAARLVPVVVQPARRANACGETPAGRSFESVVTLADLDERELAGWAGCCRVAVSAAGGTLFELAALQLPFVSIVVAENQRAFARQIEQRWGMPCVENGPGLGAALRQALRGLLARPDHQRAAPVIDFQGAVRVADAMGA